MSFGGNNKKSKDELGSSKGWRLDFTSTLSQSTSSSQPQEEPRLSRASEDIPAEMNTTDIPASSAETSVPSSFSAAPSSVSVAASSAEFDLWGSGESYSQSFQGTHQQQSSSSIPPPPPAQTVGWGAPISRPATGSPDSFQSSQGTQQLLVAMPPPPPVQTVPVGWGVPISRPATGSPDSFLSYQGTQQSSSAMSPPVQTVPVNWGTPLPRPATGQSSAQSYQSFLSSAHTQFSFPAHSVRGSCATSVSAFHSSYDGASQAMPPPQTQPTQPQPTQPVYLPTRPLLPFKTVEVPKSALHALYGKEPRRRSIAATDFVTWHDGGPPHALQWTSCFVCPLTGELFLTRPYGANRDHHEENGLIWYKKKTSAEHGAAATAYDCLTYRDFLSINPTVPPFKLLLADGELAYGIDRARTSLPVGTPSHVQAKVEELRAANLANRNTTIPEAAEAAWNTRPGDSAMPDYFRNL